MKVAKRRRRESKTDYGNRIKLLKSEKPRVVFRLTNKLAIVQYITSDAAKDKVGINLNSKALLDYGWPKDAQGSLKSIPACYLMGILMGKTILNDKKETPVVDFGMIRMLHKTKPYGFLKGLIDTGLEISCPEEAYPEEVRLKGKVLKAKDVDVEKIKSEIEKK